VISRAAFDIRLQSTTVAIQQAGGPSHNATMESNLRATVLRSLILDAVIAQEAATEGVAVTNAEIQKEINAEAQQVGGMSQLQSQLASAGGSMAQLQDETRSRLNEQHVEDRFAQQRAALVEQTLRGGADFAQTAQQYSDDTGTASKGGDLGALTEQDLAGDDAAFAGAVRSLAVNTYTTSPVHDSGGYDIIQLYDRSVTTWSARHILIAAPAQYTVQDRPAWFAESLFAAVAQDCQAGRVQVYLQNAGGDPCSGAPTLSPAASPAAAAGG
jgi:parvulin-like peptidyl-prolyl isomerase